MLTVLLWLATYASGVHPTVVGVALRLLFAAYAPAEGDLDRTRALGAGRPVLPRTDGRTGS